jgi:hypothetical protein
MTVGMRAMPDKGYDMDELEVRCFTQAYGVSAQWWWLQLAGRGCQFVAACSLGFRGSCQLGCTPPLLPAVTEWCRASSGWLHYCSSSLECLS